MFAKNISGEIYGNNGLLSSISTFFMTLRNILVYLIWFIMFGHVFQNILATIATIVIYLLIIYYEEPLAETIRQTDLSGFSILSSIVYLS